MISSTRYDAYEDWREDAELRDEQWPAAREQRSMAVHGRSLDDENFALTSPAAVGVGRGETSSPESCPDAIGVTSPQPPAAASSEGHGSRRGAGSSDRRDAA